MEKVLKRGTSEGFDRYGHYGEPGVYHADVEILEQGAGTFKVKSTMPDGREIVEYEGADKAEADLMFVLLCCSRVPETVKAVVS